MTTPVFRQFVSSRVTELTTLRSRKGELSVQVTLLLRDSSTVAERASWATECSFLKNLSRWAFHWQDAPVSSNRGFLFLIQEVTSTISSVFKSNYLPSSRQLKSGMFLYTYVFCVHYVSSYIIFETYLRQCVTSCSVSLCFVTFCLMLCAKAKSDF